MGNKHYEDHKHAPGVNSTSGEFRVNNGRVIVCVVISSLMAIVSLSMIAGGLLLAFPEPVINKRVMLTLMGMTMLAFSVFLFASNWKKYGQYVLLFSDEFQFYDGRRSTVVRWEDISAVWKYSATIENSRALLETDLWIRVKHEKTIYLTSFILNMAKLVEIILAETKQRMLPTVLSQLQHGQSIAFGNLEVQATGLVAAGRTLAWNDVQAIHISNGAIDIQAKGGKGSWYYTPIKNMPNYHIFLAAAEVLLTGMNG